MRKLGLIVAALVWLLLSYLSFWMIWFVWGGMERDMAVGVSLVGLLGIGTFMKAFMAIYSLINPER